MITLPAKQPYVDVAPSHSPTESKEKDQETNGKEKKDDVLCLANRAVPPVGNRAPGRSLALACRIGIAVGRW